MGIVCISLVWNKDVSQYESCILFMLSGIWACCMYMENEYGRIAERV